MGCVVSCLNPALYRFFPCRAMPRPREKIQARHDLGTIISMLGRAVVGGPAQFSCLDWSEKRRIRKEEKTAYNQMACLSNAGFLHSA